MTETDHPSLVEPEWLQRHFERPDLRVLDASWYLPNSGRDARAEHRDGHIPGAPFFDIERIRDTASPLPHMLPDADTFAAEAGTLGIGNDPFVVVYDGSGLFSAARAWWMFRAFGHERVAILDGGLPAWRRAGGAVETGAVRPRSARFEARLQPGRVASLETVQADITAGRATVLDARPPGRFEGTAPEPRPGLPSGHIPGSRNVPFDRVLDPQTGRVRPPGELEQVLAGVDERPVICSCGTGVTACVLAFALHRLGRDDVAVYDGSWTEWAGRDDCPVASGPETASWTGTRVSRRHVEPRRGSRRGHDRHPGGPGRPAGMSRARCGSVSGAVCCGEGMTMARRAIGCPSRRPGSARAHRGPVPRARTAGASPAASRHEGHSGARDPHMRDPEMYGPPARSVRWPGQCGDQRNEPAVAMRRHHRR